MTKQLRTVLDIIFSGFVVRTREEMKVFENLIGHQLHYMLLEEDDTEEVFDAKIKPHLQEWIETYADRFINSCRFAREFTKEELEVDIEIVLLINSEVKLIPRNLFSAVIARSIQFVTMADFLDYAVETAQKYLFPIAKEAEKEVKE